MAVNCILYYLIMFFSPLFFTIIFGIKKYQVAKTRKGKIHDNGKPGHHI